MSKRTTRTGKPLCPKHHKKILSDRVQAELLLEHIQLRSRREIHNEKRAHQCEFGFGWHLTSEEERREEDNVPGYRHSA